MVELTDARCCATVMEMAVEKVQTAFIHLGVQWANMRTVSDIVRRVAAAAAAADAAAAVAACLLASRCGSP